MSIKESRKCPVCGRENKYDYYSETEWGVVEQRYYCPRCTYFTKQCYSPIVGGISMDCPEEYLEKAKELKLDFYKSEEIL